jgi:hypothetical protein
MLYVNAMTRTRPADGGNGSKRLSSGEDSSEAGTDSSHLYREVRHKYKSLMQILSQTHDDEQASGDANTLPHATDPSAELELQQWNSMWDHLVSMVTQVIQVNSPIHEISTSDEKRAVLVDLIGKLCEAASQPIDVDRFRRLNEKYHKCKDSLRLLKSQSQRLLEEVERNKLIIEDRLLKSAESEESHLVTKVKELEHAFQRQIEAQSEFLHEEEPKPKPVHQSPRGHRRKPIPLDLFDDQTPLNRTRAAADVQRSKRQRRPRERDDGELSSDREDLRDRLNARREREMARREAEDVSAAMHPLRKSTLMARSARAVPLGARISPTPPDYGRSAHHVDLSMGELARLNQSLDRPGFSRDEDMYD